MFDAMAHFIGRKSNGNTTKQVVRLTPNARPHAEPGHHDQQYGFTKVFRWPVPATQTPQPSAVEVVASFNGWHKIPLSYDAPTKTWQLVQREIPGNHTHRYVMLVDGKPSFDKTCDGLAVPLGPEEERWQIETPKGPRVMLMFAQTK